MFIIVPVENEVFKTVTYPRVKNDMYLISNYGTVLNKKNNKVKKQHSDPDGYKRVVMMIEGNDRRAIPVHRLVAWEFVDGFSETNNIVNHINSKRDFNYYKNLEWCNVQHNTVHGYEYGNGKKGEKNYRNKFPESLIINICELLEKGYSNAEIRVQLDLNTKDHKDLIKDIRRRKTWKHISRNYTF